MVVKLEKGSFRWRSIIRESMKADDKIQILSNIMYNEIKQQSCGCYLWWSCLYQLQNNLNLSSHRLCKWFFAVWIIESNLIIAWKVLGVGQLQLTSDISRNRSTRQSWVQCTRRCLQHFWCSEHFDRNSWHLVGKNWLEAKTNQIMMLLVLCSFLYIHCHRYNWLV